VSRQVLLCRKTTLHVAFVVTTVTLVSSDTQGPNVDTFNRFVDEEDVLGHDSTATIWMSLDNSCCVERLPYVLDTVFAVATMTLVAKLTI